MVATRNHPRDFDPAHTEPPPKPSPTKRTTRTSKATLSLNEDPPPAHTTTPRNEEPPSARTTAPRNEDRPSARTTTPRSRPKSSQPAWTHTPSNLTLIWLAISLPLVIWDTVYILGRPHTMEGGWLHWPFYVPYELYAVTDYMYGLPALERRDGWPSAQGTLNAIETALYLWYLWMVYAYGESEALQGRGAPDRSLMGRFRGLSESRTLVGREAAVACLVCYTTATFTFGKTVLYWLIEHYSGWEGTGHNTAFNWITLFALPNLPWIFIPGYIAYVQGAEILQGLETATGGSKKEE